MNAIPPKNQMPAKGAPADDHIHLTMSFEDDEPEAPDPYRASDDPEAPPPLDRTEAVRTDRRTAARGSADSGAEPGAEQTQRTQRSGRGGLLPQFGDIELSLTVEVGSLNIALKDLVSVEPGQLLALDRLTTEPVTVLVNGKPFARGEIVAVGDRYGVRLLEILSAAGGDS